MGYSHTLPEDRPGADISEDAARGIAARFASSLDLDTNAMELKETRSERKKARRDHTVVWEARPGDARNLDETRFRVEVEVDGDRPVSVRSYWKVPEDYTRARSQQNLISIAVFALRIGVMAAAIVFGLWLLVHNIRKGVIRWRTTMKIAAPIALLAALGPLLAPQLLLQGYQTAIPLETYKAMTYLVVLMSVVFAFLMLGGAVALLTSFFPDALPALRAKHRRWFAADACVAVLAAVGLALVLRQSAAFLMDRFHAQVLFSIDAPDLIVSAAPAVAAIAGAFRGVLTSAALLAVIALIATRLPRRWMIVPMGLLAAFCDVAAQHPDTG